ncbi:MAG TPA: nucleotide exchange factor GrpE [Fermentimonas caenicola]|jgi:molecular chaperone GrpE|uniref:Protein GrpE n=1 Tax=Fermentimonas caenicola TaxID=1562970 RepID=A0A098C2G5_9BACT|nr:MULTISPECIES: nucleotide exchange factor GrpE [Lascolabacillus]MBP6176564.1 nucleotide exchange factor GrpE [Fermentimonas sp.]MDI9625102.1 nucleotide exchange factor GrpE [Bacteroidota bacterium]TAH62477.1 MAG: nucleotide exchange factor GrpE [Fermentimonas caenicola]MBP6196938.1 nucleotide exchange factor GrpE [Fermentimonas sp.]MDD2606901.1 nucleotide exchange factor GrpE [Lascolabacillus sp.]
MKRGTGQHDSAKDSEKDIKDNLTENSDNSAKEEVNKDSGEQEDIDEYTKLKSEYDELQKSHEDLNDSFLRLNAEFDNFRKRTIKEKAEIIKNGGERVLLNIISLVDDFERALDSLHQSEDKDAMLEGMDLIYSKFISFLKQNGVEEIESVGMPFDADTFEAVTTVPAQDESQKGKVIDCIQKGYKLNDKIIRFPKVVVGE